MAQLCLIPQFLLYELSFCYIPDLYNQSFFYLNTFGSNSVILLFSLKTIKFLDHWNST